MIRNIKMNITKKETSELQRNLLANNVDVSNSFLHRRRLEATRKSTRSRKKSIFLCKNGKKHSVWPKHINHGLLTTWKKTFSVTEPFISLGLHSSSRSMKRRWNLASSAWTNNCKITYKAEYLEFFFTENGTGSFI